MEEKRQTHEHEDSSKLSAKGSSENTGEGSRSSSKPPFLSFEDAADSRVTATVSDKSSAAAATAESTLQMTAASAASPIEQDTVAAVQRQGAVEGDSSSSNWTTIDRMPEEEQPAHKTLFLSSSDGSSSDKSTTLVPENDVGGSSVATSAKTTNPFHMTLQPTKQQQQRVSRKRKLGQLHSNSYPFGDMTAVEQQQQQQYSSSSSGDEETSSSEEDNEMVVTTELVEYVGDDSNSGADRNHTSEQQQQSSHHRSQQQSPQKITSRNSTGHAHHNESATTTSTNQNNSVTTAAASETGNTSSTALAQPEGWRVKLYRLNADGSWDDCGTGRIVCLYRQSKDATATADQQATNKSSKSTTTAGNSNPSSASLTSNTPTTASNTSVAPAVAGSDQWLYQETGEATLCVHAEVTKLNRQPRVLLRTRILLRDAYQRQGDNIITWCEPYYAATTASSGSTKNSSSSNKKSNNHQQQQGVDLALSFQDNAGCLDIWRQITHLQQRAAELLRQQNNHANHQQQSPTQTSGNSNDSPSMLHNSSDNLAAQVAARHHADLQRQHQQELWEHLNSSSSDGQYQDGLDEMHQFDIQLKQSSVMIATALPNPPTLANLEDIADTIAALQHTQQRDHLAMWIAKDECSYLKQLLDLFPAAESKGDYGKLATLAACVKTVLLMNDPSILDLIVTVAHLFEQVCSCLEYDPDLREKANHRWFLRQRAKFRTVVPMDDIELVSAIHRSFRINYLRDTLLRPTMDESALSTLSALQTFTHAAVIKGVMMSGSGKEVELKDSYLVRVIRMLGVELHTLSIWEWNEMEQAPPAAAIGGVEQQQQEEHAVEDEFMTDPSIVVGKHSLHTTTWKQYLAPQDRSLSSRRLRKRGCLSFLRELFNVVRLSLQPCDKDTFFPVICTLDIDLNEEREIPDNTSQTSQIAEVGSVASTALSGGLDDKMNLMQQQQGVEVAMPSTPVTLLSVLGSVLSDHSSDVSEKGAVLEIISGIAMHDPSLIRHCCLEFHNSWKKEKASVAGGVSERPTANEKKQIIFLCPPTDLLASLLYLLDVETDAGVLLQVSEIMRIILDTDMMGDHGSIGAGFADEAEGILPGSGQTSLHDQRNQPSGMAATSTDQKQFLSLFYEHYGEWLVAPFQFTILDPVRRVPASVLLAPDESPLMQRMLETFKKGVAPNDPLFKTVPPCALRSSFTVELLSFCVRAHLYRMKFFLLKSRVLGIVLKFLRPHPAVNGISGDRCLMLAALRFLRAILSVNDEFYYRHIIQHDLFAPVFDAFRANPVGDNLVSSAIVEMCDYIHTENIKSLLEYIVTKHMSATPYPENAMPSLEDFSSPYVDTLTVLRKAYEKNLKNENNPAASNAAATNSNTASTSSGPASPGGGGGSRYFGGGGTMASSRQLSGKALEDQRKFQAVDLEESYFDSDDDAVEVTTINATTMDAETANNKLAAGDVMDQHQQHQQGDNELHRTPRMFSLSQAPLLPSTRSKMNDETDDGDTSGRDDSEKMSTQSHVSRLDSN